MMMKMETYIKETDIKFVNSQADQYDEKLWSQDCWVLLHDDRSGYVSKQDICYLIFPSTR